MKTKVLLFSLPPSGGDLFPISLGYIVASLKEHGFETAFAEIDAITPRTGQEVADLVIAFKPTLVGFSVYEENIRLALQLARLIKQIDPAIVIALGGPQATFMPREALYQMPCVDVIVRGEGETVMPELAACLDGRRAASQVRGIVFLHDDRLFETAPRPLVADLDAFPSPYASGVFHRRQHRIATLLSSRGCTFNCAFCYTPRAFNRRIRQHSARRVLSDMSVCVKQGMKRFFFADPSFTFDKQRVRRIMRAVIRRKWRISIWCETRADLVDEPLLRVMARAGVRKIAYGLESVDNEVNKRMRKRIDLAQFERVVRLSRSLGMEVEVFTLYGLPGQTLDSCRRTVAFLRRLGIKLTGNSAGQQLNLFLGTDVAAAPRAFGIKLLKKRRPLFLSAGTAFSTDAMSRQALKKAAACYRR
ncbi:MAG TPA: radical SAM protein [Candidatus Omnitrophota bacterium]|nr:radical SAM protein [Candidatus Omnitrophota bacterium]HRZ15527.1 radical SAM protein [Candidatus Omnitrophota bacterium]